MLRITVLDDPDAVTFRLEGKMAGPWVGECERCWRQTTAENPGKSVCFDLTEVTFVDAAGKSLLAGAHVQGAKLEAAGCLMRAIVAEIAASTKEK